MIDRASTFADSDVIRMLQEDFVPVAFDQWYQRRQEDAEGKFYQRIASQGPRANMNRTTQGFYIATAGGELLHFNNNRGPRRIKQLMTRVLADDKKWLGKPITAGKTDPDFPADKPPGSVVVQVNSKVLGGYRSSDKPFAGFMQKAIGRDNLWIYPAEVELLLASEFPDSLAAKIARFHGVDNTRGEPPMWAEDQVRLLEIKLDTDGWIRGRMELATDDGRRSYVANALGKLETKDKSITRFDLVLEGDFQGEGRYTKDAPKGSFPFAVAMRLADDTDVATNVRPQALKAFGRDYWYLGNK